MTYNLDNVDLLFDLEAALSWLPDIDQRVVEMFLDNWTQEEIAAELGVVQSAVPHRWRRIIRKLRKLMPGYVINH